MFPIWNVGLWRHFRIVIDLNPIKEARLDKNMNGFLLSPSGKSATIVSSALQRGRKQMLAFCFVSSESSDYPSFNLDLNMGSMQ